MTENPNAPWWKQLSGYHWFVLLVATAAWFFDCLDQRLFTLARVPALASLMHLPGTDNAVQAFGKVVTAWFLIGWGIGGMIFGALGDRFGRARMLTITILIYSAFTGLSFFSVNRWDFTVYRFLTGLGVGGVFGLAVALIAETVPNGARAKCLGLLQVLSTIGNLTAGFSKIGIDALENSGSIAKGEGWRWMFVIGAVPALLIILTKKYLREPETWLRLKAEGKLPKGNILSPYAGLMKARRWRKNLIVGALLASTGVVGLWAIGEYAVDLQKSVFTTHFSQSAQADFTKAVAETEAQIKAAPDAAARAAAEEANAKAKQGLALAQAAVKSKVDAAISRAYILNMLGAGIGMWLFTHFASVFGRRPAFLLGFTISLVVTAFVYWKMESPQDAYWMMPLMGAAQLGPFAGFAIYLPELFPGSLRSTGTGFCYNLGRFAAAAGSFYSSKLSAEVFGKYASPLPLRYSAITMCVIFFVGIVTAFFAPETKGQPLPEDEPAK